MFSLERMRKLQKQFKSKVQSQNIIEPEYTSLAEIIRNRHKSSEILRKHSQTPNAISTSKHNQRPSQPRNTHPSISGQNLIHSKKNFFSVHKGQKSKTSDRAVSDLKVRPVEKRHQKVLRDYAKGQQKQEQTRLRNDFYGNLGRLQNKDTRDAGLANLETIMSQNRNERALKLFLNCLAASSTSRSQSVQDNEVLVLGKLVETFRDFFDLPRAVLELTRVTRAKSNEAENEQVEGADLTEDASVVAKVKNISKVLEILEKKMHYAESETSEALAIVFAKVYLLGFVIHSEPDVEWVARSNFLISKVHHNPYRLPGESRDNIRNAEYHPIGERRA